MINQPVTQAAGQLVVPWGGRSAGGAVSQLIGNSRVFFSFQVVSAEPPASYGFQNDSDEIPTSQGKL